MLALKWIFRSISDNSFNSYMKVTTWENIELKLPLAHFPKPFSFVKATSAQIFEILFS